MKITTAFFAIIAFSFFTCHASRKLSAEEEVFYIDLTKDGRIIRDASHQDDEDHYLECYAANQREAAEKTTKKNNEIIDLTINTDDLIHDASLDNNGSDDSERSRFTTISSGSKNFTRDKKEDVGYEKYSNKKKQDASSHTFSNSSTESNGSNFSCCQYLSACIFSCLGSCCADSDADSYTDFDSYNEK